MLCKSLDLSQAQFIDVSNFAPAQNSRCWWDKDFKKAVELLPWNFLNLCGQQEAPGFQNLEENWGGRRSYQ